MEKREFFIKALQAGACKKRSWVNSVFGIVEETPEAYHADLYPYRVVRVPDSDRVHYLDPDDLSLQVIDDSDASQPLCAFREPLTIHPGEVANYTKPEPLVTSYGNALVNTIVLVLPFGAAIEYQTGHIQIGKIEKRILDMLIDDPIDDDGVSPPPAGKVYVRQYLTFCDNALSMVAYASLAVTSVSYKAMMGHPDARKVRAEQVEKYKDKLADPAIVARIGQVLEDLDRDWLKGDPAADFYAVKANKYYGDVRKRLYYMFGGESPFQDGTSVEFIQKSLEEGIDTDHMPAMINSIRSGSYSRGSQTQMGGEQTKTIYRMLGTVRIAEDDCGTTLGIPTDITAANKGQYLGYWVIANGKSVLLDEHNVDSFVGKFPQLRGPLTCKTEGKNVCSRCVGMALSEQPNGIPAAAAGLGGRFLTLFLKKMHASSLSTAKWDMAKRLT
jgi:hypothetical protein